MMLLLPLTVIVQWYSITNMSTNLLLQNWFILNFIIFSAFGIMRSGKIYIIFFMVSMCYEWLLCVWYEFCVLFYLFVCVVCRVKNGNSCTRPVWACGWYNRWQWGCISLLKRHWYWFVIGKCMFVNVRACLYVTWKVCFAMSSCSGMDIYSAWKTEKEMENRNK